MDLVYTDANHDDMGILLDYSFDLAFGSGENDFELKVSTGNNVISEDCLVYIDGTEYGGIVDGIKVDTANKTISYTGRTWHGIMNSRIIIPTSGEDYFKQTGEANYIIGLLISAYGLSSLFSVSTQSSGVTYTSYQFDRYVPLYDGIVKMLKSKGLKLHVELSGSRVLLSAVPSVDYSTDEELDSDQVDFEITRSYNNVNHLICLGQGNLKNRQIVNLYCDTNGNISTTKSITGLDEYTDVYDYPNVESISELIEYGKQRLKELNSQDKLEMRLNEGYSFDIGDTVSANEHVTGISVTKQVVKKIVTINKEKFKISYKVGE